MLQAELPTGAPIIIFEAIAPLPVQGILTIEKVDAMRNYISRYMLTQSSCIYSSKLGSMLRPRRHCLEMCPRRWANAIREGRSIFSSSFFNNLRFLAYSWCTRFVSTSQVVLIACCSFQLISLAKFDDIGCLLSGWYWCHASLASLVGRARSLEIFFVNVLLSKPSFINRLIDKHRFFTGVRFWVIMKLGRRPNCNSPLQATSPINGMNEVSCPCRRKSGMRNHVLSVDCLYYFIVAPDRNKIVIWIEKERRVEVEKLFWFAMLDNPSRYRLPSLSALSSLISERLISYHWQTR